MIEMIPFKEDEWAILNGVPKSGVSIIMIGVGEKNVLRSGDGNEFTDMGIFKKGAILLKFEDGTLHFDPNDQIS